MLHLLASSTTELCFFSDSPDWIMRQLSFSWHLIRYSLSGLSGATDSTPPAATEVLEKTMTSGYQKEFSRCVLHNDQE